MDVKVIPAEKIEQPPDMVEIRITREQALDLLKVVGSIGGGFNGESGYISVKSPDLGEIRDRTLSKLYYALLPVK
jgi:hypothetical protein